MTEKFITPQTGQNSLQKLLDDLVDLQDILDHKRSDSRPITSGPYRDEILEKWSTKLELATGKLTMKVRGIVLVHFEDKQI